MRHMTWMSSHGRVHRTAFWLLVSLGLCAGTGAAQDGRHAAWNRLLQKHVDEDGQVAYADWQQNDLAALDSYLESLATAEPESWPEKEQLAFWINAYNAGTIYAILHGYSAESLIGRAKLFKFFKFTVAGKKRSLDEIEHDILRVRFEEPRIHFAIVCASASCPELRNEAFMGSRLDGQLEEQAHAFIGDPGRNTFLVDENEVRLSKIFDWFESDFGGRDGLLSFLAAYVDADTRRWLQEADIDIEHHDYDWTLNAQEGQRPSRKRRPALQG